MQLFQLFVERAFGDVDVISWNSVGTKAPRESANEPDMFLTGAP